MKVVFITATLQRGGAERVISVLANEMVAKGEQVEIVKLLNTEDSYKIDSRIKISAVGNKWGIEHLFKLRKILAKRKDCVIVSFGDKFNIYILLAGLGLGLKIFVSDRNNPFINRGKGFSILKKILYKKTAGIIAQTQIAKDTIAKFINPKNIVVIANPLTKPKFTTQIKQENIVVNIGRFIPSKNQIELIAMFDQIDNREWRLVLVGEGPTKERAQEVAQSLKCSERVIFTGDTDDVWSWLKRSKIFAFTSKSEGFPNALLEGMAARLACLSYDCPTGPSELIRDGQNGFLVPMGNTTLYRERLEKLMNEVDLQSKFSENGIVTSMSYSAENITALWLDFFKAQISKK